MKGLLRPARLSLVALLAFAAAAAAPGAASAQTINGTATGKTIPLGDGTFRIVGTLRDASTRGVVGTYVGTYVEVTTGYTTCRDPRGVYCYPKCDGTNYPFCNEGYNIFSCNYISGSVTVRLRGESSTFRIGGDYISMGYRVSVVCLDQNDPEIHEVELFLTDFDYDIEPATGFLGGTSTPGKGGVYEDAFSFAVRPGISS